MLRIDLPCFAISLRRVHNRFRKGLTSIEFALIAPVFFLFFIGLVEMSLLMLAQHLLENATFNASRAGKTGFVAEGKTQLETIMDILNREIGSLSPLMQVSKLSFSSESYGELSDVGLPGQGTAGTGAATEIVVYTVTYPWKVFTPLIGEIIADENNIVRLTSRIVVRNEPYN